MKVNALDHVNIITADLPATVRFYAELLDLEVLDGPPPLPPQQVQWVYDEAGRPIVHVNALGFFQVLERDARPGKHTGAVHHVALNCSGYAEMIERLSSRKLPFHRNDIASIGLRQLFVEDPNGVLLELNFYEGPDAAG